MKKIGKRYLLIVLILLMGCASNLITSTEKGNIEMVKALLEKGADVNEKGGDGKTALMKAAEVGHIEIVKLLLAKGADVNAKDKYGRTAFKYARGPREKGLEIRKTLIDKGANIDPQVDNIYRDLIYAAEKGYSDTIKFLLAKGADVNAKDSYGWTALMHAVWAGYSETVEILLERNANINARAGTSELIIYIGGRKTVNKESRETALMKAAKKGFTEIVKILLDKGADVNAKDGYGETALKKAVNNGHDKVAELLKKAGALDY